MPAQDRPAALPDGQRLYAIGDIHGRADLLDAMADLVARDLAAHPVADPVTVCLGDYGDRGPDTAGVLDRLIRNPFPTRLVTLRGNHDALFLDFLDGAIDVDYFSDLGGAATMRSYGIDLHDLAGMDGETRLAALRAAVPPAHRAFLDRTAFSFTLGDYFCCHAGARPGVPLERQDEQDLIWIREEFLDSTFDFGRMVVHGHTPVRSPKVRVNGINVDTKAFASGILTAFVAEGTTRRFLQTRP